MNKILESCLWVTKHATHVKINEENVSLIDENILRVSQPFTFPFPSKEDEVKRGDEIANFYVLGDAINFCYWRKENGKLSRWEYSYKGIKGKGARGLWLLMRELYEREKLKPENLEFFAELTYSKAFGIFGNIPLLSERVKIWNEVGKNLLKEYNGSFKLMVEEYGNYIFGKNGFLNKLIEIFPIAFTDKSLYKGREVYFCKKALLLSGMLHERFGIFKDVDEMVVFADYQLPRILHYYEILIYEPELEKKIANLELIPKDSEEEVEIRASTIVAAKLIENHLKQKLKNEINALVVDCSLWRKSKELEKEGKIGNYHLTLTTCY